jgi:hypothetical protein
LERLSSSRRLIVSISLGILTTPRMEEVKLVDLVVFCDALMISW